ncbi:MAG: tetratricopeptide repeat protein [Gammaproteobacteria bacterium]
MKFTSKLVTALALGAVLVGAWGYSAPVHAADEAPKVSKAVAKPLKAAQDAMQAKKYDEALAKLKEVQGMSGRSPYDDHLVNEMLGFVYVRTSQYPEAAKALEAGLNSGFLEQAEVPNRVRALAQVNYQIKNYDKAIEFGNRAVKGGFADDDMYTLVAQAYYIKGDYPGTQKFVEDYIDVQIKGGKQPKEQTLQLMMSSCVKVDNATCTTNALEKLVSYYPKPEYWQNLLYSMFQQQGQTDRSLLHVYRLASEVDVLKRPDDYTEFAQLAIEAGSPGEAQAILEKGLAKNVFTDPRALDKNKRLLESAKKQAQIDQAGLEKVAADAAAAKTGDKDVSVGLAYLGYKQYGKAVTAIERGLGKPGVQNEAEARLLLGIAELGAGHKEEAQKAFKAVKGDPKLERLANLWDLHARQA